MKQPAATIVNAASARAIDQETLPSGIDLLWEPMPGYHTATVILRVRGGMAGEPADLLGLSYVMEQALDKGTQQHDARALANAFDAIGASYAVHTGLQSWVLVVSALPEFIAPAVTLLGEMLRQPTFPDDAVKTAVHLAQQELTALEDSPQGLLRREMARQAYGPTLGRHRLGSRDSLAQITPAAARTHWQRCLTAPAVTAAVAGRVDRGEVRAALTQLVDGLPLRPACMVETPHPFTASRGHLQKDLEQTQMGISFPGLSYGDLAFYVEKLVIEILSGGMGARLFTEVREKLGLVYWVAAWHEQPRGLGMIHLGAATTPERCDQTFRTLIAEVARLHDDVTADELHRAKVGLLAERSTSGASVYQRAAELMTDHFQLGYAVPAEERIATIKAITIDDIKRYLATHPRDALSIVTIGSQPLKEVCS